MSSSTMPKEAREEIRRLSNKNAALERQNTELRMKNAEMKRHNAALQIKVSKFDKKVDKVVDRVVKEMRTLQNPDDTEEGDTATPKGPPQKKPRPDPQSTTCPSTSAGGDSITASDQDRGLDSIIAAISRSAQKNPSGREDQEKKFTLGASLGTQDDAAGDASRGADRKLLDMMKTFLESTQPKKFNPTL